MFFPKIHNITPDTDKFIQIIDTIADPPKSLYYIGNLINERKPAVAIVGTRRPTTYGRDMAYKLSYGLASRGVVVVSGMALGIDAIAHTAALDASGTTVAVQANGLDKLYPFTNRALGERIVKSGGLIVSEYEPGTPAMQFQFLARNRIVSGLSDGVLVVEAAARSGTLATANHALDQGRSVMAVPGNATSPMSAGCNKLLKSGATLVTEIDDILEAIGLRDLKQDKQPQLPLAANIQEKAILDLITAGERDGETLQRKSGLDVALFSQTLSMLEITGKIKPLGANQWTLS